MIRAKDILESVQKLLTLNEDGRTVINIEEIEKFLKYLGKQVTDVDSKRWISTRLRSYIINRFPFTQVCDPRLGNLDYWQQYFDGYIPNYARIDFETGRDVFIVKFRDDGFKAELNLILEFLHSPQKPKKTLAIEYEDMLIKALQWRKSKETLSENPGSPDEGTELMFEYGSLYMVRLNTEKALDREGVVMHNCINGKDYGDDSPIFHSRHYVFSLRKRSSSESVCSFLLETNEIRELKGPRNGKVDSAYHKDCRILINKLDLSGVTKMGLKDLAENLDSEWDQFFGVVPSRPRKTVLSK
jgi:hypothetical protein